VEVEVLVDVLVDVDVVVVIGIQPVTRLQNILSRLVFEEIAVNIA
jgi:hypothetical protein